MKFVAEYRDADLANQYIDAIAAITTRPWAIMEICGGQTHTIVKYGIDRLLPAGIRLIHGPGCPVCVTPTEIIDAALAIARQPRVIFCSFGDMLRIPGSIWDNTATDLLAVKAAGGDVRIVYSPLDAEGFLAAGHVCTVMGYREYKSIADRYQVPIIVTGFEPVDLLQGIYLCLQQLEAGTARVENQYSRSVRSQGNPIAQQLIQEIFEVVPQQWRGLGSIPQSGLGLRSNYAAFDALKKRLLPLSIPRATTASECISGQILQGIQQPHDCPAFGTRCTPEHPLGAPMVSSEGACAAYYRYRSSSMGLPDRRGA
jgi:hydrogenase expression/formation protein HypD